MVDKNGFKIGKFVNPIELDRDTYNLVSISHGDEEITLDQADMWYMLNYLVDEVGVGKRSSVSDRKAREKVEAENDRLRTSNERLRELVSDMWHDGMCDCDEYGACARCEYGYLERMRALGIEVKS